MEEIKKSMKEMEKLLFDFQEEHKKLVVDGTTKSEAMTRMEKKISEMADAHQKAVIEIETERKARESLELAVARGSESQRGDGEIKSNSEYIKAFDAFLRHRKDIPADIVDEEVGILLKSTGAILDEKQMQAYKAMAVASNPDGGYFVPTERLARIIKRLWETSPMRQIATIINTSTESVEMILDDGEFAVQTPAELDPRTQTPTSKIGIITIPVCEHTAMPAVTQKLLDDAIINIEAFVQDKIADKIARTENHEFVLGTGNKECSGFIPLPDWTTLGVYERGKLETRVTSTALAITGDDLLDLQSDLLSGYQMNATWTMHRKVWVEILKLKDLQNQYLLNPAMLFSGSLGMQMLGRPVVMFDDMESTLDEDNIVVAYGDFREGYMIVDRIGIRILRDPYTAKGAVLFYASKRTGGGVVNYQSIKRLKVLGS